MPVKPPRRAFVITLIGVIGVLAMGLLANRLWGGEMGAPCADSYSCRGFLFGGVECAEVDGHAYCTIYCDTDADCPPGFTCQSAHPTALGVETSALDDVCIR